ncbi:hypothetical protein BABA_03599 [Neobacillus bataviensis LMG 21833]|uniref:Uncharacterized protein n=1 Tax=Neobacillus bataviensis LMG 21833 TaxID=1117379 RepID=K6CIC7_9BACI|nr:hypothetical protein [Neobacillus bataviensis]EKN70915.1 hypothetical protein BABA_03599 [Neobacillus bataviensis LMG 21833]
MFKRVIILGVLSLVLIALVLLRSHTAAPVYNPSTKSNDSSEYTTVEYKISKIEGNQYYGKSNDGTGIIFSTQSIVSDDEIHVDDVVICYFEKGNLGKGLVKVKKK